MYYCDKCDITHENKHHCPLCDALQEIEDLKGELLDANEQIEKIEDNN